MGWFKHICHECNLAFNKSIDFILHRQEHISRPVQNKREEWNR